MTTCTTRAAETWACILAAPDGRTLWMAAADYAREDHDGTPEEVAAAACAAVEAVAQQHLDAHPDDHKARRLLGEWLEWHGDERGEGYRALARRGFQTFGVNGFYTLGNYSVPGKDDHSDLPNDWFEAVRFEHSVQRCAQNHCWGSFDTRRAAENAAAFAFARLPAERRAQLLKGQM